ncbi:MAG: winged helix-turn-helix domain-containing protein [Streptosporangiaceae bacterium]
MRYPDGGGLSAAGRVRREKMRLQAAEWFAEGVQPPEVARRLRVSCYSASAWRRRWRAVRGTSYLLHRLGYTPQVPVHRAAERDEDAIAAWRAVTWAKVRG